MSDLFVSYHAVSRHNSFIGSYVIKCPPVATADDVKALREFLQDETGHDSVSIISFHRLESPE